MRLLLRLVVPVLLSGVGVSVYGTEFSPTPALASLLGLADRLGESERAGDVTRVEEAVVGHWFDPERAIREGVFRRQGDQWTVTIERRLRDGMFYDRLSDRSSFPKQSGESDRTIAVRSIRGSDYEWVLSERTALNVGTVAAVLESYSKAFDELVSGPCNEAIPLPELAELLGGLAQLSFRCLPALQAGHSPSLQIAVNLARSPSRKHHSAVREFLSRHLRPAQATVQLSDAHGVVWADLRIADGGMDLRLSKRRGPQNSILPSQITVGMTTRKGPFRVGVQDLVGSVEFFRTSEKAGVVTHFRSPPEWRMPFFVRPLVKSSLNRPFLDDGAKHSWSLTESGGVVFLDRESSFSIRPHWLTSWMGGSVSATRADMSGPVAAFSQAALRALVNDLSSVLGDQLAAGSPDGRLSR